MIEVDWSKSTDKKEWNKAYIMLNQFNEGKNGDYDPVWDFDVSFKLDYDGNIVSVNSRFYPPPKNVSGKWEGNVSILILGKTLVEKEFTADNIYSLKPIVEAYVEEMIDKIKVLLINNIPNTYGSIKNIHQ